MLALRWRDHLSLICVCKQIYAEARESFFRRPLTCRSQDELIRFVRTRPNVLLQSITNVRLHLQEVDSEVMQPFLARISVGMSNGPNQHPYLTEINRITRALSMMPSVTEFSLLPPFNFTQSVPSSTIVNALLEWMTARHTMLHKLRIDFDSFHLDSLAICRDLQSLQLSGYSETDDVRAAEIFSRLGSIESLTVIGPPQGLQMRQRHGHQARIVQSITYRVLNHVRPLKRLVIKEAVEASSGPVFLTSKTLRSIYEHHCESLRMLHISSSLTPDAMFTTFLEALLMATPNIRELALTWPGMQVAFIECVPASVQRLTLLAHSRPDAQALVDHLRAIQYRLPFLKHIRFEIINAAHGTATGGLSITPQLPPRLPPPFFTSNQEVPKDAPPFGFMLPIQNLNS